MILSKSAFDTASGILATTNCLETLPSELFIHGSVTNEGFDHVLTALTKGHSQPPATANVRANARYHIAMFYLSVKKRPSFFGECSRGLVPRVLKHCRQKDTAFLTGYKELEHARILSYALRENAADWIGHFPLAGEE